MYPDLSNRKDFVLEIEKDAFCTCSSSNSLLVTTRSGAVLPAVAIMCPSLLESASVLCPRTTAFQWLHQIPDSWHLAAGKCAQVLLALSHGLTRGFFLKKLHYSGHAALLGAFIPLLLLRSPVIWVFLCDTSVEEGQNIYLFIYFHIFRLFFY